MRKVKILVLVLLIGLFITGCGSSTKKLTCTNMNKGNNMNAYSTAEYTFNEDGSSLLKAKGTVDFKDIEVDDLESRWDDIVEQFTSQNEPVEEEGLKRTVSRDDKNFIFTVTIEIDYSKVSKETLQKYTTEDFTNKTYDEIKELSESDGATCK